MKPPVIIVCGVRPQFIKVAAFLDELQRSGLREVGERITIFDTHQHYDSSLRHHFSAFDTCNTVISDARGAEEFGKSIEDLVRLIKRSGPSTTMIVFGDATPGLVGAVAASRFGLELVHIEAGVRREGFEVEDANSRIVDSVATFAACVAGSHARTLRYERFRGVICVTGDIAERYLRDKILAQDASPAVMAIPPGYILVTCHRPMNSTAGALEALVDAVRSTGRPSVWVHHPRNAALLAKLHVPRSIQLKPQPHRDILALIEKAHGVITDSGGLIREAHHLQRRCFVPQTSGGWPEIFEIGGAVRCTNLRNARAELGEFLRICEAEYPRERPLSKRGGATRLIRRLAELELI